MFNREKLNFIERWWLLIDKKVFSLFTLLIFLGCIFSFSFSTIVAERIGIQNYYFFRHQIIFSLISLLAVFAISIMDENLAKKSIFLFFSISFILMLLTPIFGFQTKGAKRWLYILGFSVQPVEFLKPALVLLNAYLLNNFIENKNWNYIVISIMIYFICLILIAKQPDIGNLILISIIFFAQLFLLDIIKIKHCIYMSIILIGLSVTLYLTLPHVSNRIDNFLLSVKNLEKANYQVRRSVMAYQNANWLGRGFLEGNIKNYIPDVHTDFIFPAITEEFGFIISLMILLSYFYIIIRILILATKINYKNKNHFIFLTLCGLILIIFLQISINICVSMNLLPTKGMTLPLLSYGGSSLLGTSIIFGYILVFTKKRFGIQNLEAENIIEY